MSTQHDLYAYLSDEPVALTEIIHGGLIVDFDADGGIVGVEVLGASGVSVDGVVVAGEEPPSHASSVSWDEYEVVEGNSSIEEAVDWLRRLGEER